MELRPQPIVVLSGARICPTPSRGRREPTRVGRPPQAHERGAQRQLHALERGIAKQLRTCAQ
eukprot:6341990-Alexandrium_andersonii.AAC.1